YGFRQLSSLDSYTLSLHVALPICLTVLLPGGGRLVEVGLADGVQTHPRQGPVDPLQGAPRATLFEEGDRLRQQQCDDDQREQGPETADVEDDPPVTAHRDPRGQTRYGRADAVPGGVDTDGEPAVLRVRELAGDHVGAGQHAAHTDSGEESEETHHRRRRGHRG